MTLTTVYAMALTNAQRSPMPNENVAASGWREGAGQIAVPLA
jgi:hypothetical protein